MSASRVLRAAACGLLLLLVVSAGPALGHRSNDWVRSSLPPSDTRCRTATSQVNGAFVNVRICWLGYQVWVRALANDKASDRQCAVARIRYRVFQRGRWLKHWHFRSPKVSCRPDGHGRWSSHWMRSRYPTRWVQGTACRRAKSGRLTCVDAWR